MASLLSYTAGVSSTRVCIIARRYKYNIMKTIVSSGMLRIPYCLYYQQQQQLHHCGGLSCNRSYATHEDMKIAGFKIPYEVNVQKKKEHNSNKDIAKESKKNCTTYWAELRSPRLDGIIRAGYKKWSRQVTEIKLLQGLVWVNFRRCRVKGSIIQEGDIISIMSKRTDQTCTELKILRFSGDGRTGLTVCFMRTENAPIVAHHTRAEIMNKLSVSTAGILNQIDENINLDNATEGHMKAALKVALADGHRRPIRGVTKLIQHRSPKDTPIVKEVHAKAEISENVSFKTMSQKLMAGEEIELPTFDNMNVPVLEGPRKRSSKKY